MTLTDAIKKLQAANLLEGLFGKEEAAQIIFHLDEIDLDVVRLAERLQAVADNGSREELVRALDSFQYGSLTHMKGHLEALERIVDPDG